MLVLFFAISNIVLGGLVDEVVELIIILDKFPRLLFLVLVNSLAPNWNRNILFKCDVWTGSKRQKTLSIIFIHTHIQINKHI